MLEMDKEKSDQKGDTTMKYALIGCGRISPNHIAAAQNNKLEMVAICDIDPKCMEDKALKFKLGPEVKHYTDYKEMLEKEKPELAAICTESGKHAEIAIYCIEHGCHCIIEKPIALSIKDADAIISAAIKHHVKVSACHQNRFNKSVQIIREAIDMNRFGRLFYGTAHIRWCRDTFLAETVSIMTERHGAGHGNRTGARS